MCNYVESQIFSPVLESEAGEKAAKEEAVVENTTPDYAAVLVSAQVFRYKIHPNCVYWTQTVALFHQ